MALVLGTVAFQDWEIPETMPFGGSHLLRSHRLIGGKRVIDALGPDEAPLRWRGRFRGPLARLRERQLDTMRRSGKEYVLTYETFVYRVVIADFRTDAENFHEIPYEITCEVIEDLVAASVGGLLTSLEESVTGDLADALGLATDSPIVTGIVTAGQAAVTGVLGGGGFSLSTLGGAAMAGLQGGFASQIAASGGVAQAASSVLGASPLASVLGGPVSGMASGVQSVVQAGEIAWRATGVQSMLTRAAGNLVRAS